MEQNISVKLKLERFKKEYNEALDNDNKATFSNFFTPGPNQQKSDHLSDLFEKNKIFDQQDYFPHNLLDAKFDGENNKWLGESL